MSKHVLIVEDEPMIALELEQILTDAGYVVSGVAGSVEGALALVSTTPCDVAVLDRNLRGQSVEPVAALLQEKRTPFLFVSGYGRETLSAQFNAAPLLSKPVDAVKLVDAVRQLLSA